MMLAVETTASTAASTEPEITRLRIVRTRPDRVAETPAEMISLSKVKRRYKEKKKKKKKKKKKRKEKETLHWISFVEVDVYGIEGEVCYATESDGHRAGSTPVAERELQSPSGAMTGVHHRYNTNLFLLSLLPLRERNPTRPPPLVKRWKQHLDVKRRTEHNCSKETKKRDGVSSGSSFAATQRENKGSLVYVSCILGHVHVSEQHNEQT
eukprot:gene4170-3011_t